MCILMVGCGNMGSALLTGIARAHPEYGVHAVDPSPKAQIPSALYYHSLADIPANLAPDVIILAVKPQQFAMVLPEYAARFKDAPLYISIAAGRTLATLQSLLGEHARIVRTMPNLPASIGQGVTALMANAGCTPTDQNVATALFASAGETLWLEDEAHMHPVTAISGSGPAYIFLVMESLMQAGIDAGLAPWAARLLALNTVSGSAALAKQSEESFATLRENVTSPGGTTEAALATLMRNDALQKLLKQAVTAATERSQVLAN
jgi:pyrroline-5-carboxylate reductase